jgi:hypothetical protein
MLTGQYRCHLAPRGWWCTFDICLSVLFPICEYAEYWSLCMVHALTRIIWGCWILRNCLGHGQNEMVVMLLVCQMTVHYVNTSDLNLYLENTTFADPRNIPFAPEWLCSVSRSVSRNTAPSQPTARSAHVYRPLTGSLGRHGHHGSFLLRIILFSDKKEMKGS